MSKPKRNIELLHIMDEYVSFMDSEKKGNMPVVINKTKVSHPTSLYKEIPIISESQLGNVVMDFELRNKDCNNYTIQILTDKIETRVLTRFDEGNGTHKNNLPSIPLQEQQVTTPHFHRYSSEGYFLAYKTVGLKSCGTKSLPINDGMREFCKEMKITSLNEKPIEVIIKEEGVLPLDFSMDPLDGINFE